MPNLQSSLTSVHNLLKEKIKDCSKQEDVELLRIQYLGKKGEITAVLKGLGKVDPKERAEIGKLGNQLKNEAETLLKNQIEIIQNNYYTTLAKNEYFDVTATPSFSYMGKTTGSIHPISKTWQKLEEVFTSMGFSIMDGPQIETDYNNFEALNFTDDHPARDMQDTFYTTDGHLLRTHTSAVQVRAMQKLNPPMRMIVPGRVFRFEEIDASHEHTFYQMEGMLIDKKVSVSNLLYLMQSLLKNIFEKEVNVRLRPGYFPFVEPGFELDMECLICDGKGCSVCKKSGWVEVLPCGLVHPNVIKSGGLDPNKWQGAAFGLGLNRLVMMHNHIEDIRYFQNPNIEFLNQFN